jgi:peptide/nickel transport system substrate-binding protein
MPDHGVAMAALASGELDLHESPATDLLGLVEDNPDVVVIPNEKLGYQLFMVLNHLQRPFDNKAVRQAVLSGMKQNEFLMAMAGTPKRYTVCAAVYGCGLPNESSSGTEPLLNAAPEKAKSTLQAAGALGAKILLMDPTITTCTTRR